MSDERRKILEMLAEGKLTVEQAERLLAAVKEAPSAAPASTPPGKPRWLRVRVDPRGESGDRVDVKVPLMLLRTGLKLGAVLPGSVQGKVCAALGARGIDVDLGKLDARSVEALIDHLSEVSVEVQSEGEHIQLCCE